MKFLMRVMGIKLRLAGVCLAALLMLLGTQPAAALTLDVDSTAPDSGTLHIAAHSGSPLLLQLTLEDPRMLWRSLELDTGASTLKYRLPETETHEMVIAPFLSAGSYPVRITLSGDEGSRSRELAVGFSDFVWGRDNFRFSNKRSSYWGITPYSAALYPWVEKHFGRLPEEEFMLLLNTAYHIFTGRVGRCYAFSASQVLFTRHPDLLPYYYRDVYAVREYSRIMQERMNFLQNDIMFDHFILGGYDVSRPQLLAELQAEIEGIMRGVDKGEFVPVGYWNAERHHSMLIYGYIYDPGSGKVTLIAANNWGTEHDENLVSEAAELIDVNLQESFEGQRVTWIDPPYANYDHADHFFAVEVKESFEFSPDAIAQLIAAEQQRLAEGRLSMIIIEEAKEALLTGADGAGTGTVGGKVLEELPGVNFRQVSDTLIFEFPTDADYRLSFTPLNSGDGDEQFETDCRVYVLAYAGGGEESIRESAFFTPDEITEDREYRLEWDADRIMLVIPEELE